MNKKNVYWIKASLVRALKTVAQTMMGMITVGVTMDKIDWVAIVSTSLVAGIFSIVTSVATTLPEVPTDGVLQIDTSDPEKDVWQFVPNKSITELSGKKNINLSIDSAAILVKKGQGK